MLPSLRVTAPPCPPPNSMLVKAAASKWPRVLRPISVDIKALTLRWTGICAILAAGPYEIGNHKISIGQWSACPIHGRNVTIFTQEQAWVGVITRWVNTHWSSLTVRVKITPAASFSKIKGDAIANVCRCIQTQMGTSVFNCK